MVPYLTERMLQQSPTLAPLGALAAQHCERMDGSGYPRGLRGAAIPIAARVLAAASVYQAMCEPRPHRPAHAPEGAALELRGEVRAGRLAGEAVEAVLRAAGHRARGLSGQPSRLTAREVEVLRLVARGQSTKEVARQLGITPKTAGEHGTGPAWFAWERSRYDWSEADRIRQTVIDSNVLEPGSTWELRVRA